ncbi:VWA domain-containing protein [Microvirga subterranea]|uniref:Ca-activated chloride channel family protein n=1 Tax=Microvirga subterranea TaxID=186651 RepID=A0A370HHI8_9HYPH|nr:VWA domain-containing protein [Microvirga subterranea]RDI57189.1 Ca-activated chloride channel family protein [Microvirga subterranea]
MSTALASFHLLRPWWLLLLIPALVVWWLLRRGDDASARWASVIDPGILRALIVGGAERSRLRPHDLLLAVWLLGILAVAGPTWKREPSPFADARPPVMVVLKVAPSMKAADLAPSRLVRSVQKLSDLVAMREGASTGLVAYAGSVHLVLPPTPDKDVVVAMAQALSPEIMPRPGDGLAQALRLAGDVLREAGKGGSILVMADGVAPDQVSLLQDAADGPVRFETTLWAAIPPSRMAAETSLRSAASAIDATLDAMAPDRSDVETMAARLDRATVASDVAGEGERWQEAGYGLTPLLALLTLAWFRRGWVLGS